MEAKTVTHPRLSRWRQAGRTQAVVAWGLHLASQFTYRHRFTSVDAPRPSAPGQGFSPLCSWMITTRI